MHKDLIQDILSWWLVCSLYDIKCTFVLKKLIWQLDAIQAHSFFEAGGSILVSSLAMINSTWEFHNWWIGRYWFKFVVGNLANYLKLQEVDSMHFPVPVNFIFVGFEGKGNQGTYLLNFEFIQDVDFVMYKKNC